MTTMTNGERGFTLVELLIATAIFGVIMGIAGNAIYGVITSADYGGDQLIALHELQNVANWVGRDGQGANNATGGEQLVLTIPDGPSITYSLSGTELHRTGAGSQMTLARNISSAEFSVSDGVITMTLICSPPGHSNVSEQGTYQVLMRVEGQGQ